MDRHDVAPQPQLAAGAKPPLMGPWLNIDGDTLCLVVPQGALHLLIRNSSVCNSTCNNIWLLVTVLRLMVRCCQGDQREPPL